MHFGLLQNCLSGIFVELTIAEGQRFHVISKVNIAVASEYAVRKYNRVRITRAHKVAVFRIGDIVAYRAVFICEVITGVHLEHVKLYAVSKVDVFKGEIAAVVATDQTVCTFIDIGIGNRCIVCIDSLNSVCAATKQIAVSDRQVIYRIQSYYGSAAISGFHIMTAGKPVK